MAAGASSRMKKSLDDIKLSEKRKTIAANQHKTLIPLTEKGKNLLYFLCSNAKSAGYKSIYILTAPNNEAFKNWVQVNKNDSSISGVKIHFPVQYVPKEREKPLGTADGIEQALYQFPQLLNQRFTVCNADNLYSTNVLKQLLEHKDSPHSIIAYNRDYLNFPEERITKFALMHIDNEGYLKDIVEKPPIKTHNSFRNQKGELLVSMNIFSFTGTEIFPYLKNCPLNQERNEKELPEAVRMLVKDQPKSTYTYIVKEHLQDLTSAKDINQF